MRTRLLRSWLLALVVTCPPYEGVAQVEEGPIDMLAIARRLSQTGLCVIPIDHPHETTQREPARIGKTPVIAWKQFQKHKPSDAQLRDWFGNGHKRNVGILTGSISGIVAVDADSTEAVQWMHANLPPTRARTKTSKGEHGFYRHPGIVVRNAVRIRTPNPAIKIDVRGDGGYVVGPGSLHASGALYEPLGDWPAVSELPVFDPGWLESTDAEPSVDANSERALELARKYLEATPGAREGHGGDSHTYAVACKLTHDFGLSDEDAYLLLRTLWNPRCEPPWADEELRTKIRNARAYGKGPVGAALDFPHTEIGDAETFAATYGDRARYDYRLARWLVTSETGIWIPDPVEMLRAWVIETMRERQRRAMALSDIDDRKRAFKWAIDGESSRRVNCTLREARAMPPIADEGDNWDPNPLLLGGPTGVVDLTDGTLRRAEPDERVTMRTRATFDLDAKCPLWEKTIAEVFNDDRELIDYIQRACGYSITGDCREECFFVCYGEGGNGKGTVMNTIAWLLGEYADDLPFSTLERMDRNAIPADIAKLPGKRFVTASESGETAQLNEARIKALTGRDPITARFLHRNFFTFQPVAKFWLSTNAKPVVRDDSEGFWRRVHLIPFTQSFTDRPDYTLKDRLRAEAPGILTWLVLGAMAWQHEGLNPPAAVRAATQQYRRENEPLTPFIEARCVRGANAHVRASALFADYRAWCDECRVRDSDRLNQTTFGKQMRKHFAVQEGRHVEYIGVGLRHQHDDEPSEF